MLFTCTQILIKTPMYVPLRRFTLSDCARYISKQLIVSCDNGNEYVTKLVFGVLCILYYTGAILGCEGFQFNI